VGDGGEGEGRAGDGGEGEGRAGEGAAAERLRVPAAVRNNALAVGAESWLRDLPGLVGALAREWEITVGDPFEDATEAFVARAVLADGTPAVLKLLIPRAGDGARREITVLRLADGQGCARLLRSDPERGAMLLERLGRSMRELGLAIGRRHEILCGCASALWRPAPEAGLPTGADKGRWLAEYIARSWEELGRPCSERAVEYALSCAARRAAAHDDERALLLHGDVHEWNTLQAGDGFKLVDPDGLLAEPEYDLGVMMREDPVELLDGDPRARARWLARRCGLDAVAIWEWGVAERVSTGLMLTSIGVEPVGRDMLAAADYVAARPWD
jgi:streptomycin 6-kinase